MENTAGSNSRSPVPLSTINCTKGSAASASRFRTCGLINSIFDVILPECSKVGSYGLWNAVKHCTKDILLHDQILPAANPAGRKCGHTQRHKVRSFLKRYERSQIRFTPTGRSWLNVIERWFRDITCTTSQLNETLYEERIDVD